MKRHLASATLIPEPSATSSKCTEFGNETLMITINK